MATATRVPNGLANISTEEFHALTKRCQTSLRKGLHAQGLESSIPLDNQKLARWDNDGQSVDSRLKVLVHGSHGTLEKLPFDIVTAILSRCDLQTLTTMRRVNSAMRSQVDSLASYAFLFKHASHLLRAFLATESAERVTCPQIKATFCSVQCEFCPQYGTFINLLRCSRVCPRCIEWADDYDAPSKAVLPLTKGALKRELCLEQDIIENVPKLKSLPGSCNGETEKVAKKRCVLFDRETANLKSASLYGGEECVKAMSTLQESVYEARSKAEGWPCRAPTETSSGISQFMTVIYTPFERHLAPPIEEMASHHIILPTREVGVECLACTTIDERHKESCESFTHAGFIKHLETCQNSMKALQALRDWTAAEAGGAG